MYTFHYSMKTDPIKLPTFSKKKIKLKEKYTEPSAREYDISVSKCTILEAKIPFLQVYHSLK